VAILPLPVPTCIQYPRYTPHLQYKCHKPLHTSTTSFFTLPATQIAQRARRKRDREWRSWAQPEGDGAPSHSLSPSLPRSHRTVVPPLRLSNNTALHGPGCFPVFDSRPREPWRTNDVPLKYLAQPDSRVRRRKRVREGCLLACKEGGALSPASRTRSSPPVPPPKKYILYVPSLP